jgi:riboflavin synthase
MFTGLVQMTGRLERIALAGGAGRLLVRADLEQPAIGESIAVNGVCLTLAAFGAGRLEFDVLRETLERTALGDKAPGAPLHLERALRMGDAVGGHWVSGHVDGTGTLVSCRQEPGGDRVLAVRAPQLAGGIVRKGSVALDGVSLTVVELDAATGVFGVHLVPHTWQATAFATLRPGDRINIETDMLGKYARQRENAPESSSPPRSTLTMERLRAAGFA